MILERRHLQSIKAIAEAGNLARAADRLYLTQSALSHQIKTLEHHFEVPLFLRHTKPIRLSPAGQKLLQLADKVLPLMGSTEEELTRMASGELGRLHIAIECHACYEWLMPVLEHFKTAWPGVEIDIKLGLSFDSISALRAGDLDLVISSDPVTGEDLTFTPLFRYEGRLIMSSNHPLAAKKTIEPEDLRSERLITYPVARDRLDVFKHFLSPAGVEPREIRQSDLTAVILLLVASGQGVAALPDWVLESSTQPSSLTSRPLGTEGLHGTLYAATRRLDEGSQFLADFSQLASQLGPGRQRP